MKKNQIVATIFVILIFCLYSNATSSEIGLPIKFLEGCEVDFDGDTINDYAFLYEGTSGMELIAILNNGGQYKTVVLYKGQDRNLHISCQYLKTIKETVVGKGERVAKTHIIEKNGIILSQPESSSSVFYWKAGQFFQIWTSD